MIDLKNILFWTERVYLEGDETSSKDPMGTEAFAAHLADLILPGMTTITWRVRYITLICQWIDFINNEMEVKDIDGVIKKILQMEKLAAFSMVSVPEWDSQRGTTDYDDKKDNINLRYLIGKRYARAFKNRATIFSLDRKTYPFLTNHRSAGAYSVYKVLLVSLGLLDESTVSLTEKGKDLLDSIALPVKPFFIKRALNGEDIDINSASFITLGKYWGLTNFSSDTEKNRLKRFILSEPKRRNTLELLRNYKNDAKPYEVISDIAEKNKGDENVVGIFKYIQKFERVNREVHFLFYSLLSTGADQIKIDELLKDDSVKDSISAVTGKPMNEFLDYHEKNEQILIDGKWVSDDQLFLFYRELYESKGNPYGIFEKIISYHCENQKRKAKVPWVNLKDGKCTIILHRYKIENGKNRYNSRDSIVHNYRLGNAWRMIDDLGI